MIKGLDNGYSHTKDNEGRIFRSAYTKDYVTIGKKLTIDGVCYQVGSGCMTAEVDKTNSEINKVCTIYNLVLSGNTDDLILSVGLPIDQYKVQKEKLKESILGYNNCEVIYDDQNININIKDVLVNPQGISALYSTTANIKGKCIVIDIGGLTIDNCLVEFTPSGSKILKYDTLYKGMRTLYSDIVSETNNKFNMRQENIFAEELLKNGYLLKNGVQYKLDYLKPILQRYVDELYSEITLRYQTETTPIYLVGGGASFLYSPFVRRFGDVSIIGDSQFANAIGYHNIACYKYRR